MPSSIGRPTGRCRPTPVSQPSPEQLLHRLEWTVIRKLDGLLQGDYRNLFRGFGLDLADLREDGLRCIYEGESTIEEILKYT